MHETGMAQNHRSLTLLDQSAHRGLDCDGEALGQT